MLFLLCSAMLCYVHVFFICLVVCLFFYFRSCILMFSVFRYVCLFNVISFHSFPFLSLYCVVLSRLVSSCLVLSCLFRVVFLFCSVILCLCICFCYFLLCLFFFNLCYFPFSSMFPNVMFVSCPLVFHVLMACVFALFYFTSLYYMLLCFMCLLYFRFSLFYDCLCYVSFMYCLVLYMLLIVFVLCLL